MLKQQEIIGLRNILLSERMAYKGTEIVNVYQLLGALAREEAALRTTPVTVPPATEPKATE